MGKVTVETPEAWFDNLGGATIEGAPKYPFRLRTLVAGYRVTPRHSLFRHFLDMGSGLIPKILRHEPLGLAEGASLLFVLPERWMSVHEQQMFIHRLTAHPEANKLSIVDIVTQEALIVSGLTKESVALFQLVEGDTEAGLMVQDV